MNILPFQINKYDQSTSSNKNRNESLDNSKQHNSMKDVAVISPIQVNEQKLSVEFKATEIERNSNRSLKISKRHNVMNDAATISPFQINITFFLLLF